MSTTATTLVFILLLLLSPMEITMARFGYSSTKVTEAGRIIRPEARDNHLVLNIPGTGLKGRVFQGHELEDCLPKGIRHTSAPSHYGNYETLGSNSSAITKRDSGAVKEEGFTWNPHLMKEENTSFCSKHVKDPCVSFCRKCNRRAKEQRSRFYILRRCVVMLVCWHDRGET